jgi:hypothetical protein
MAQTQPDRGSGQIVDSNAKLALLLSDPSLPMSTRRELEMRMETIRRELARANPNGPRRRRAR